jgi:hypothetical protein
MARNNAIAPASNQLTKEQEDAALAKIKAQEEQKKKVGMKQYVEDVKSSLLFRPGFNWNELLSAAPTSVMLLASVFVASTVPDATDIRIIPPTSGFKYLINFDSNPSLNACLVQCADTGIKAFGVSNNNFDAIIMMSSTIRQIINDIIHLLGDAESAKTMLVPTIKRLADVANRCEDKARGMEQSFQSWLDMVCELHQCIVQTSTDTAEKKIANQIHLAAAKTRLTAEEDAKKLASESVSTLKGSLETATAAYKKAADEFPSGWDLVAQQLVSNLGDCLTNAINLAVPALIENYSTTAKIKDGINIFKGDTGGAEGGSVGEGKQDNSNVPPAEKTPNPIPSAVPPFPNDPAYGVIPPIAGYTTTIQSFVTGGADHGVDWELLKSKDPKNEQNGLGVLASLMEQTQKSFKPSQNQPSIDLEFIFSETKKVTDGLQEAIQANSALNGKPLPKDDSEEVRQWRLSIEMSSKKAVELNTNAMHLSTAKQAPSVNEPQAKSSPTDKNGAMRQQIIDAATTKLNTTASVMQTATENYQKASDKLVDVQVEVGKIQAELAGLEASNINLDKIKAILVKCIDILVQLKSQINRLVAFFSAVSSLVEHVVEDQVKPFITYLDAATGIEKEPAILNFSFTNFQQQIIYNFCLSIRAYFDLFRDIGGMYLDVYTQFIRPGLEMVTNMQSEYNSAGDPKSAQKVFNRWIQSFLYAYR